MLEEIKLVYSIAVKLSLNCLYQFLLQNGQLQFVIFFVETSNYFVGHPTVKISYEH